MGCGMACSAVLCSALVQHGIRLRDQGADRAEAEAAATQDTARRGQCVLINEVVVSLCCVAVCDAAPSGLPNEPRRGVRATPQLSLPSLLHWPCPVGGTPSHAT